MTYPLLIVVCRLFFPLTQQLYLHYHLLLVACFLLGGVLFPVLKVRKHIAIMHPNYAVLDLGVHSRLKRIRVHFPMVKVSEQALTNHIADN